MSMQEAYKRAKQVLKNDINSLKRGGSDREATEIQTLLSRFYTITSSPKVQTDYLSKEDYDEVIKFVEEITDTAIDRATLSVASEQSLVTEQEVNNDIQPLKGFVHEDGIITVQPAQLNRVCDHIKLLYEKGTNINETTKEQIKQILGEVKKLEEYTKSRGRNSLQISNDLIARLNQLYSKVNVSVLKQKIGKIGEYFAGAAVAAANAKITNHTGEIIDYLKWAMKKNALVNTGDNKTYHYQATFEESNNGIAISTMAVDDKVDMEVFFSGHTIPMSVKNYTNISKITIFKGNLLSLLAQQHYNSLLRTYAREKTKNDEAYALLRKICFVKALSGGVLAMDKSGNIISTPTAKYLVVNHQGKRWYVWPMYNIIRKYEQNEKIAEFDPELPQTGSAMLAETKSSYNTGVFSSHISLYTSQLRNKNGSNKN